MGSEICSLPRLFCDGCHKSVQCVCLDCIGKKPMIHCDECSDSVCLDCMDKKPRIFCGDCSICVCITLLKAHLANIRSTSGLPKLDPFSLYVGGIGKRRGK